MAGPFGPAISLPKPYQQDFVKVAKLSVVEKREFCGYFRVYFLIKTFNLWVYPHFPQSFPQTVLKTICNLQQCIPIQRPILNGFGNVHFRNVRLPGQISDGAGNLKNAVMRPCGKS